MKKEFAGYKLQCINYKNWLCVIFVILMCCITNRYFCLSSIDVTNKRVITAIIELIELDKSKPKELDIKNVGVGKNVEIKSVVSRKLKRINKYIYE